jgi:hypothetical protein
MNLTWVSLPLLPVLALACAHQRIPGTRVPDTAENREVMAVLEKLQAAMQARDVAGIVPLVSPKYFEDNGTPDPTDDYGYGELKDKILPESFAVAAEMHVSFDVHDIRVEGEKAHADIRYDSRARLELPSGTLWDSHREFNRVVFAREDGAWRIVSGL